MPRLLRITLMWLLTLAIPVQGFAAASMLGCATDHHGSAGAGAHSHAAGPQGHEAAAMHPHSHDEGDAMVQTASGHHPAEVGSHADTEKAQAAGDGTAASCSACAACCTSAALPATRLVFEPSSGPDVFVQAAAQRVATFISGGLERPPRSSLA